MQTFVEMIWNHPLAKIVTELLRTCYFFPILQYTPEFSENETSGKLNLLKSESSNF